MSTSITAARRAVLTLLLLLTGVGCGGGEKKPPAQPESTTRVTERESKQEGDPQADDQAQDDKPSKDQAPSNARERLPELKPLAQNNIVGSDADNDHVRDDVAEYIDDTFKNNEAQRLAMRQLARAMEQMLAFTDDPDAFAEAAEAQTRAIECLIAVAGELERDFARELEARVVNTEERLKRWLEADEKLGGSYVELTRGNPLSTCRFDLEGLAL